MDPKFPDIEVQLTGEDSNVFNIIGKVRKALWRAGETQAADAFADEAMSAGSYDEVLQLVMRTVTVA